MTTFLLHVNEYTLFYSVPGIQFHFFFEEGREGYVSHPLKIPFFAFQIVEREKKSRLKRKKILVLFFPSNSNSSYYSYNTLRKVYSTKPNTKIKQEHFLSLKISLVCVQIKIALIFQQVSCCIRFKL